MRVDTSVWWPGVSQVRQVVEQCKECAKEAPKKREPRIITPLPGYPWQMVGVDLFELNKDHYLLIVDYFSRYPEVIKLTLTTATVIKVMNCIFLHNGIPEVVRSDNGPQGSLTVLSFSMWLAVHGMLKVMVRLRVKMIIKSDDPYLAKMSYL